MTKFAILSLLLVLAAPLSAFAQDLSFWDKYSIQRACAADVETLCGSVQPGEGRMLSCVREKVDQLSPGCAETIAEYREQLLAPGEPMDFH